MFSVRKLDLLISIYIFCIIAAELMGGKTFPLANIWGYKLNASVAIFLLPILFTINDMVTEVFGKERTKSIIRSGLLIVFLSFLASIAFTQLPPSPRFLKTEASYDQIFGLSARISAASLIAFAIAEFADVILFVRIRKALGKKALWLRNNLSNFVAQFLDTVIFMTLAFYALDRGVADNVSFLTSLIITYWLLKCLMSVIETPLVYLGVNWLKSEKE